jgi:hypothetical protein
MQKGRENTKMAGKWYENGGKMATIVGKYKNGGKIQKWRENTKWRKNDGKMVGRQTFPYRVEGGVDGAGDNSRHILQHEGVGRVHEVGGVSLHQPTTNITPFAQVMHVE